MSKKMSTLFHEFIHDNDLNGNDEIIRETNAVVAEDDIEVGTMLDDQVGEKYFYKCMELAENVIKSFEDEQPQLNPNQQIVLDWLKERFNETEIKASCTGYLWKLHQSYIDDEADEAGIAYEELSYEEESEVVRVFAEWVIEQGEEK